MRIHELKCRNPFFEEVIAGSKNFTVRKNDRAYAVGDVLAVNEVAGAEETYTGRCCVVLVTYLLEDPAYCKEGFVIMGFRPCSLRCADPSCYIIDAPSLYGVRAYTEVGNP